MKNSVLSLVTITLLTVLTGCTGLSSVSQETDETELIDIAWLENQLQAEGIFASPSGPGNWGHTGFLERPARPRRNRIH